MIINTSRIFGSLSKKNLIDNFHYARDKVNVNSKIVSVIKANAYGHGIIDVATFLDDYTDLFGVSYFDEALLLRKNAVNSDIVVLYGISDPVEMMLASEMNVTFVVHTPKQIEMLETLPVENSSISVWIKVDTGLGRIGFDLDKIEHYYNILLNNTKIKKPICVISHSGPMSTLDDSQRKIRFQNIEYVISNIKDATFSFCNSEAIFSSKNLHLDFVRSGMLLYGFHPLKSEKKAVKPVMSVISEIINIRHFKKGQRIGYNGLFECNESITAGIAPVGYGYGYPRISNGFVVINNKKCQIIGEVSMDMMIINLRECTNAKIGDKVILFDDDIYTAQDLSNNSGRTITELLSNISKSTKFHWIE